MKHISPDYIRFAFVLICSMNMISCDPATVESRCTESDLDCVEISLELSSEHYQVNLVELVPSIPQRGVNVWQVQVNHTQSNETLEECSIKLVPYMPEHRHGSPKNPSVSHLGNGKYQIDNIVFTMPGLWDMRFNISCENLPEEQISDTFWLGS